MSKAFTKEDTETDDLEELDLKEATPSGKNYMTPQGADKLRGELLHLMKEERPRVVEVVSWAASNGDRSENGDYIYGKRRLREIDRRIRFLTKRLDQVEIVDPEKQNSDQILFGATVTVEDEEGHQKTYKIVGADEADATHGKISWMSPIAKALLGAREGDVVIARTPGGDVDLEVTQVRYQKIQ